MVEDEAGQEDQKDRKDKIYARSGGQGRGNRRIKERNLKLGKN